MFAPEEAGVRKWTLYRSKKTIQLGRELEVEVKFGRGRV
jgi:hypothetical protein